MPMSPEAANGLRAAVAYNPAAARYFMQILRTLPISVRYKKEDRYGPLALMISAIPRTTQITDTFSIPLKHADPFPQEKLKLCETFNEEWLQRRFTKQELADAIELLLAEIEPRSIVGENDPATTLILSAEGTFLANDLYEREMKRKIDPEHG